MPQSAHLAPPGVLHHIIGRGTKKGPTEAAQNLGVTGSCVTKIVTGRQLSDGIKLRYQFSRTPSAQPSFGFSLIIGKALKRVPRQTSQLKRRTNVVARYGVSLTAAGTAGFVSLQTGRDVKSGPRRGIHKIDFNGFDTFKKIFIDHESESPFFKNGIVIP